MGPSRAHSAAGRFDRARLGDREARSVRVCRTGPSSRPGQGVAVAVVDARASGAAVARMALTSACAPHPSIRFFSMGVLMQTVEVATPPLLLTVAKAVEISVSGIELSRLAKGEMAGRSEDKSPVARRRTELWRYGSPASVVV